MASKVGRKPKPTKLKLLQGNPGGRPLNPAEPVAQVPAKIPAPPAALSPNAKKHWKACMVHLHAARVYTVMDELAMIMFSEAFAEWVEARKKLEREGSVVYSPNGYPQVSPYVTISNKAWDKMYKMLTEFGMTPASRTKVKSVKPEGSDGDEGFSDL